MASRSGSERWSSRARSAPAGRSSRSRTARTARPAIRSSARPGRRRPSRRRLPAMRCLVVLVLIPALAVADPKRIAETQKLVTHQLDDFDRDESHQHGFKKWASNAVAWFPGQYGERAELNRKAWATTPPPFLGSIKVAKSAIGWNKNWGWVVAQLDVSQRTNPDMRYGEYKA